MRAVSDIRERMELIAGPGFGKTQVSGTKSSNS